MADGLMVFCTCPDDDTGKRIAGALVGEHLAACVNRMPGVRSTYRWQGQVMDEPETLLIIKTVKSRYDALEARLKALHPYEVPEIIAIPVVTGSVQYLTWLAAETGQSS